MTNFVYHSKFSISLFVMVTFLASILIWLMCFGLLVLWVIDGKIKKETVIHAIFSCALAWGIAETIKIIFENIRLGGTLLLLGLPAGKLEVDFSKEVVFKGLTIKGIYGRRIFDTWDLMGYLLAKGLAKTILESGIITHQLALRDFEQGFGALLNGQAIKVLLKP